LGGKNRRDSWGGPGCSVSKKWEGRKDGFWFTEKRVRWISDLEEVLEQARKLGAGEFEGVFFSVFSGGDLGCEKTCPGGSAINSCPDSVLSNWPVSYLLFGSSGEGSYGVFWAKSIGQLKPVWGEGI